MKLIIFFYYKKEDFFFFTMKNIFFFYFIKKIRELKRMKGKRDFLFIKVFLIPQNQIGKSVWFWECVGHEDFSKRNSYRFYDYER